jgi:hypothetical protein
MERLLDQLPSRHRGGRRVLDDRVADAPRRNRRVDDAPSVLGLVVVGGAVRLARVCESEPVFGQTQPF